MFPVEVFQKTLNEFIVILQRVRIRFHLTGGVTAAAYGEPRMTQDIDIVIDPQQSLEVIDLFVEELSASSFLFDERQARQAIKQGTLFQLLHNVESLKLDVYPRELIPGELDRSVTQEIFEGQLLPIVSRIDAAASKLVWISKGSHKGRRDLRAIYRNASKAEKDAIQQTCEKLNLLQLLNEVLAESDELQ